MKNLMIAGLLALALSACGGDKNRMGDQDAGGNGEAVGVPGSDHQYEEGDGVNDENNNAAGDDNTINETNNEPVDSTGNTHTPSTNDNNQNDR